MTTMKRHVFDLDNTLVYTNLLNNASYNYALSLLGLATIVDCKRITRKVVFNRYPDLNSMQKNKIIELKQEYFINNLKETIPNKPLIQLLKSRSEERCILWTSADKTRVLSLLKYYKINNAFKEVLFSSKFELTEDIVKICELLECGIEHLVFYENNQRVIRDLQRLNLNVISVSSSFLI